MSTFSHFYCLVISSFFKRERSNLFTWRHWVLKSKTRDTKVFIFIGQKLVKEVPNPYLFATFQLTSFTEWLATCFVIAWQWKQSGSHPYVCLKIPLLGSILFPDHVTKRNGAPTPSQGPLHLQNSGRRLNLYMEYMGVPPCQLPAVMSAVSFVCNAHLNIFTWNLRDINVYYLLFIYLFIIIIIYYYYYYYLLLLLLCSSNVVQVYHTGSICFKEAKYIYFCYTTEIYFASWNNASRVVNSRNIFCFLETMLPVW